MPGIRPGMTSLREHSRQLVLAPGAQAFLCLELRHAEQMAQHLQPVALRQLDQFGDGLRDEGHGLVRAALLTSFSDSFLGWRRPTLARSLLLPAASCLTQKTCIQSNRILSRNNPFRGATLGSNTYLCGYKVAAKSFLLPDYRFDRGPLTTHVRVETVGRESRGTRLYLFP
jgi:hypothetical protein